MRGILACIIGMWIAPFRIGFGVDERGKVTEWTAHGLGPEKQRNSDSWQPRTALVRVAVTVVRPNTVTAPRHFGERQSTRITVFLHGIDEVLKRPAFNLSSGPITILRGALGAV